MLRRVRQFRAASTPPSPDDYALAREWLAPTLLALFEAQHPRDIAHAAATARWLLARGCRDPELLAAALLHDVGKGQQRRRDRAAAVVAQWIELHRIVASPSSRIEMRRALHRSSAHSEVGATRLHAAGAPCRVVQLVRNHHAKAGDDVMLALLQQADAAS